MEAGLVWNEVVTDSQLVWVMRREWELRESSRRAAEVAMSRMQRWRCPRESGMSF